MWKALLRCLNRSRLLNTKQAERSRLRVPARKACRQERKSAVAGLKQEATQNPEPKERPSRPKPRKKEDPRNLKKRKENAGPPEQRRKRNIHAVAVLCCAPGCREESIGGGGIIRESLSAGSSCLWRRATFAKHAAQDFTAFRVDL